MNSKQSNISPLILIILMSVSGVVLALSGGILFVAKITIGQRVACIIFGIVFIGFGAFCYRDLRKGKI